MAQKEHKLREVVRQLAALFFSRETPRRRSLLTVTDAEILSRGRRAVILITVMPEAEEKAALDFARRRLADFRAFVHEHSRIVRLPFFEIRIDKGEKNRQRIDEIGKNM
ncbi:MAG: ribosome-binding factor [Candidatus Parcubacteria bacterium]|jgi:ribosome-binding factor A|nr:ribosome-binding factor [Candidatus Parcubacteria bacterium]